MDYVLESKVANLQIGNIIDEINRKIIDSKIGNNISLILICGGFGRGEGSVVLKENYYSTSNDFDLLLISEKKIEILLMNSEIKKISDKSNIKSIDILNLTKDEIEKKSKEKKITQSLYDMIFGSKVLYYKKENDIIFWENVKRSYHEVNYLSAFEVIRTRTWALLANGKVEDGVLHYDYLCGRSYEFYCFQIIKAATAIVDAICIVEDVYDSVFFMKKIDIFRKTKFYNKNIDEIICRLIENKMKNLVDLSLDYTEIHMIVYKRYLEMANYCSIVQKTSFYKCILIEKYHKYIRHINYKSSITDIKYLSENLENENLINQYILSIR